jgi:hypothetical protein
MLSALNAVKMIFRDNQDILDKWFICYVKAGTPEGSVDQYNDLLAEIGRHVGLPLRREDLDNYFVNTTDQRETAIRAANVARAFSELSANTHPRSVRKTRRRIQSLAADRFCGAGAGHHGMPSRRRSEASAVSKLIELERSSLTSSVDCALPAAGRYFWNSRQHKSFFRCPTWRTLV